MKKYRHRKTGEIATYKDGVLKSSGFCVEIGVEPSKEFWEEVKETYPIGTEVKDTWTGSVYKKKTEEEWIISDDSPKYYIDESKIGEDKRFTLVEEPEKDYEIITFFNTRNNTPFYKVKDGMYSSVSTATNGTFTEKEFLSKLHFKILSVRRLKDDEVFTVGDECEFGKITKIFITEEGYCMTATSSSDYSCNVMYLQKTKPILFTTEDGVDIRKGDEVFIVQLDGFKLSTLKHIANENWDTAGDPNYTKKYKRFSSKEKAEEFVVMNKPCLSINDIEFLKKEAFCYWDEKLKQLVKSKLK